MLKHLVLYLLITCVMMPSISVMLGQDTQKKIYLSVLNGQPLEENHKECKSDQSTLEEILKGTKMCCSVPCSELFISLLTSKLLSIYFEEYYPPSYIEIITPPPKQSFIV
ncbi:MAG TPA: hypothetical protein VIK89_08550 [Cytophagaceae bacterium]